MTRPAASIAALTGALSAAFAFAINVVADRFGQRQPAFAGVRSGTLGSPLAQPVMWTARDGDA